MQENLNDVVRKFLAREQIEPEQVINSVNCNVDMISRVNPIVAKFGMYKEMQDGMVSIGDVIGFEDDFQSLYQGRPEDVFEGLSMLFDEGDSEYKNRSLSMLNYSKDDIIAGLSQSFEAQPIIVKETGEGTYSVAGNGKHRFMLLRALYLSELAKVKDDMEEVEKLKNKYKIPAKVESLDFVKTYTKYFLMTYGISDIVSVEFSTDFHYKRTGHTEVKTNEPGVFGRNASYILDDVELIKYTKSVIQKNQDITTRKEPEGDKNPDDIYDKKKVAWIEKMYLLKQLPKFYRTIKSFREFFDANMADVYLGNDIKIEKVISDE